jgi:hypothetical protein
MKRTFLPSLLLLLVSGCAHQSRWLDEGKLKARLEEAPRGGAYVEAIGIGASDTALPTDTQRRALARDAAIVKAQYELLSRLKGVELDGGITVERAIEIDSKLRTRIDGVLRSAEVVRSEFTSDSGCIVTLRLAKKDVQAALASR